MILSKCVICGSKKQRFIKKEDASGILGNLNIKTPLSKIPLLEDNFFWIVIPLYAVPLSVLKRMTYYTIFY